MTCSLLQLVRQSDHSIADQLTFILSTVTLCAGYIGFKLFAVLLLAILLLWILFKRFKKKVNPCADGGVVEREVSITEYFRYAEFSPSRDQLLRYHNHLKRPVPTKWDSKTGTRKISFGEEQLKTLILRYKDDKIYPLILEYRKIDKIAGTYVGRPDGN